MKPIRLSLSRRPALGPAPCAAVLKPAATSGGGAARTPSSPRFLVFCIGLLLGLPAASVPAAVIQDWSGNQVIPDHDLNGVALSFEVSGWSGTISDLTVSLDVSGGYNGDLYAYLTHESGFAVLLNRVGRGNANPDGNNQTGFLVSFNALTAPDIHRYQDLGSSFNSQGQLIGTWAADGRAVSPDAAPAAFDGASRDAMLSVFNGLNPNGYWTLLVADASSGWESTLKGFSVSAELTPVPEPAQLVGGAFVALLAGGWSWGLRRRKG